MIEVENLSKIFKIHEKDPGLIGSLKSLINRKHIEKYALKNVSFQVQQGEILGLIGSNGAGKTTLAKILSGIVYPTSGKVSVIGFDPSARNNEYRKQMSLIMGQKAQLWWDLPALDSFLLLKEIYQIPKSSYNQTIEFLADKLQIKDQLKTQIRKLSLGERMKVELMAALLHHPKVVFLDEPTIGLDLNAQKAVREFILNYRKEFKPIMILTSHYMEDIENLCERIIMLKGGEIVYNGPLKNITENYITCKEIECAFNSPILISHINSILPDYISINEIEENKIESLNLKFSVHKNKIKEASLFLLNNLDIKDFHLSETNIGDIISNMMQDR